MRSLFDDRGREEEEKVFLFQGEFPGYAPERLWGTILKQEERYATLKLIGVDLSPIVTKKQGTRIAIDMEVYFETRVPGKFSEPVILGKGEAYYFPHDLALYIQDLYIRQAPGKTGGIIPIHTHTNTLKLWQAFEKYLRKSFPEAQHITTPLQDVSYVLIVFNSDNQQYGNFTALLNSLGYKKLNYMLFQKKL